MADYGLHAEELEEGAIPAEIHTVYRKGRPCKVLIDDLGYDYTSPLVGGRNTLRWRCSKKKSMSCIAFLVTREGIVIRVHFYFKRTRATGLTIKRYGVQVSF